MTARPMTEVLREASLEDAQSSWMDPAPRWAERSRLLSEAADEIERLSAAVRGMREKGLELIQALNTHDIGAGLRGQAYTDVVGAKNLLADAIAALSGIEGEDEQATRASSEGSATAPTDRL